MDANEAADRAWAMRVNLLRVALSILHHGEDAEDAVSAAMLKAYRSADRLRDADRFAPWLMRTLVRCCYDVMRDRRREVPTDDMEAFDAPALEGAEGTVLEAIQALPRAYQKVLVLYYYEGFKAREIAHILSMPLGTVLVQLSRGRGRLREILEIKEVAQDADQAQYG